MKSKGVFLAAILTVVLCVSGTVFAATYGGGSGTVSDPYKIGTPAQMNTIGVNPADWNKNFKLIADVNMSEYTGTQYKIIGNSSTKFVGTFDGNGYKISNLTYTTAAVIDYVGLFGRTNGATIKNLGVENVLLSSGGSNVGGLVGRRDSGTLTSCHATGSVSGKSNTGGLIGLNSGSLTSCYATGSVGGTEYYTGGLVGQNLDGSITDCYATGAVIRGYTVGGLVGYNAGPLISCYATGSVDGADAGGLVGYNTGPLTSCYATGSVGETGYYQGGLVGQNLDGSITDCYATGSVDGYYAGGLVGRMYSGTLTSCGATGSVSGYIDVGGLVGYNESGTIIFCYAIGPVSGFRYVGGLVGYNGGGAITSCYATGSVSGDDRYGNSNIGGLVALNDSGMLTDCYATGLVTGGSPVGGLVVENNGGTVANSFWDKQASGQTTSAGGTGKTTAEMMMISTFTSAGWNFINVWVISQNQTYPYLMTRPLADLNYDGMVNLADFAIIAGQWLEGT